MMLRISENQWRDLVTVMGIYSMDQDLQSLQDLASNRVVDGLRFGIVSPTLFNRLELPQEELSNLARASALPWAYRLSEALTEIIKHGEWYPQITHEEEEAKGAHKKLAEEYLDQDPGSGELLHTEPEPELIPVDPEIAAFLEKMHQSKLPTAREFFPDWFADISQK